MQLTSSSPITLDLVVRQSFLNLAAKVKFTKMSNPQEKPHGVSWNLRNAVGLYRRCQTSKPSEILDANMEESHLRGPSFDHGLKSSWRLAVWYKKRKLADLKHQKNLNLCVWDTPEALES